MGEIMDAYKDPNHPGNKIRPRVVCWECGKKGCVTAWGNWCFDCNVKRIERISASFEKFKESFKLK
jgi:hypothetical protein